MNGISLGNLSGCNDAVGLEITLGTGTRADANGFVRKLDVHGIDIGLRIDGDGFDSEFATGADDAEGNFPPVGDENTLEHEMSY